MSEDLRQICDSCGAEISQADWMHTATLILAEDWNEEGDVCLTCLELPLREVMANIAQRKKQQAPPPPKGDNRPEETL